MTSLKPHLQRVTERINALALRERVLIFMATALVLVTLLYVSLIDPMLIHQKQMSQHIGETRDKINVLGTQIQAQITAGHVDPNAPLRARLEQLQTASVNINKDLRDMQNGLVTPQQISMLLKDILQGHRSLNLVSLKTLPTQRLAEILDVTKSEHEKNNAAPQIGAYKHGFEIILEGEYLDMLHYLAAIEASPWQVFWGDIELNANTYPKGMLTVKLYTLSLDQTWLTL